MIVSKVRTFYERTICLCTKDWPLLSILHSVFPSVFQGGIAIPSRWPFVFFSIART